MLTKLRACLFHPVSRFRGRTCIPAFGPLPQSLGVLPPLIRKHEEQRAVFGVFGLLRGASAFLRVLVIEASERHGTIFQISSAKGPDTSLANHPNRFVAACCSAFNARPEIFVHFGGMIWPLLDLEQFRPAPWTAAHRASLAVTARPEALACY